jgi:hypothetical protein
MTTENTPSTEAGAAATPPVEAGSTGAASPVASAPVEAAAAPEAAAPAPEAAAPEAEGYKATPSLLSTVEAKPPTKEASETGAKSEDDAAKPAPVEAKSEPAEPVKTEEAKTVEAKTAPAEEGSAKAQPREYEAFKVPDGITLDSKRVKEFTDVLDDANLSHQDRAQKLLDFHVAETRRIVKEQQEHQRKVWTEFTDKLKSEFKTDPDLGGNRELTSLGQAKYMIEQYGGSKEQVSDLLQMLDRTGVGNYVGLVRVLNNLFEKYENRPIIPANPPTRAGRASFQDVMYADKQ